MIRFGSETESKIQTVQTALADRLPPSFSIETDPHLTILPGAVLPKEKVGTITRAVYTAKLIDQSPIVIGIDVYPKVDPYVVRFNVDMDLHHLRTQLINNIYEVGGELLYPPVPPHVTLFKRGDTPENRKGPTGATVQQLYQLLTELNNRSDVPTSMELQDPQMDLAFIE